MLARNLSNALPGRLKLSGSIEITEQHLKTLNTSDDFMCVAIVQVGKPNTRLDAQGDIIVDWTLKAADMELVVTRELQEAIYDQFEWMRPEPQLDFPEREEVA